LPLRLSKIDELTRPDHTFLEADDECFYLGEYTARKGYQFSETNNLIYNLKKPMDRRGRSGWEYKQLAIEKAGKLMREALEASNPRWLSVATLVPIPPSKTKTDPMYDDRMFKVLQILGTGIKIDVRELVIQRQSTEAAHSTESRPRVDELYDNYAINESLAAPTPRIIGVFDDLLTTGAHFKAVQRLLRERFRKAEIYGIFIARRIPDTEKSWSIDR
jgi:hypothetical protein